MTLLRVYQKNGNSAKNEAADYRFSDLVKDFFGEDHYRPASIAPRTNILENKESFELEIALPGVRKEDVSIDVNKDMLTIAHREKERKEGEVVYNRKEFDYSRFKRSFSLPESVNTEGIKARMENGILSLVLPKKDEAIDRGPRQIDIS